MLLRGFVCYLKINTTMPTIFLRDALPYRFGHGQSRGGKEIEVVFLPKKVADRLSEYVRESGIDPKDRIFPITYGAARIVVIKAGKMVGIHLKSHDLRRHAATYASRSGTPLEIISKVLLRHANLSTTQIYLGTISDIEAIRWIDSLHG